MRITRTIIPYIVIVIILAVTGYFSRLNHNAFEKAMVDQAQTQLLITALSEAQSIERHSYNTEISAVDTSGLVKHIDDLERVQVLIVDDDAKIKHSHYMNYIGENLLTLLKGKISNPEWLKLNSMVQKIKNGEQGTAIIDFFSDDVNPNIVKTLLAFAPIHHGNTRYSIIVAMEYDVVAEPVNKNARDNIAFGGFVLFMFFVLAASIFRHQKKKADELQNLYSALENEHIKLKTTQTQLIQAEKMGIVGKLSSGVAHEVKNPLMIIMQGIEYLKEKLKTKDEDVSMALKDIEEAVGRADNVVRGLLDFASVSKLVATPESINLILDNSLLLMKNLLDKNNIKITRNFEENIPYIIIDKNKIQQVFLNIILNSVDAMPGGGDIIIRTYAEQPQDHEKRVIVQIEDTGTGIPEGAAEKIFEPFFTTKHSRGGHGLGLPMVKNIIEMHGGKINISNRTGGKGTVVIVSFKA
ncbi:MAG: ATP-binding protein [Sedimentisphaerales bacterium]|jgi:signal transduction histidine kinase